ncbi:MAG TPA: hypothetical protein VFC86_12360, partial [Planctomycetota bacterium]|nr:hypothetical protein [Planctomycetota bacterium]
AAPRFEVVVKERTDELKPSRLVTKDSERDKKEPAPGQKDRFHLATVILEIPLLPAATEKPAEPVKEAGK